MKHWYKTIDEYYKINTNLVKFNKLWKEYENKIIEYKHRPCDIANLIQKNEKDIENVFKELI